MDRLNGQTKMNKITVDNFHKLSITHAKAAAKMIDRNFDSSSSAHSNGPFSLYHSFFMYNGQALT